MPRLEGERVTLRPIESHDVVGLEGEDYPLIKVGPTCAKPGCTRYADHSHHLFSRGLMGGAYDWVLLPDGTETSNRVPLCFQDHEKITNNEAAIEYDKGVWYWQENDEQIPLAWQPPNKNGPQEDEGLDDIRPVCPGCGRRLPKPKIETPPEEKRVRRTWAVSVPADVQENGADTLDALVEAAREELDKVGMSYSDSSKARFYVLATSLGLFVQHFDSVVSNE
jgi:hypothetical protein